MKVAHLMYLAVAGLVALGTTANGLLVTTDDIARHVGEASDGAKQVTANIAAVSDNVSHTRNAAVTVTSTAEHVHGRAEHLQHMVDDFITKVGNT